MSNILKNNNIPIDFRPCYDEYWDFCLNTDLSSVLVKKGLQTRCLISYIDTNNSNCVWFDKLYGNEKYKWEEAVNSGVNTNYIGYTGVDNGFINYQKDRISNQKFYDLFTKSNLTIAENDFRIRLNKVYGNNMIYDYTSDIVEEDGVICSRLNGGFYQGFFKLQGEDYQVLPDEIGNGLYLEFTIKKSELENENLTLNKRYPENKGMFFYIGTRAENKWWINYKVDTEFDSSCNNYSSEYVDSKYTGNVSHLNDNYVAPTKDLYNENGYFSDDYLSDKEISDCCYEINIQAALPTLKSYNYEMPEYLATYQDNSLYSNESGDILVNNEKLNTIGVGSGGTYTKKVTVCGEYLAGDYVNEDYFSNDCNVCDMYVKPEYLNVEKQIDVNEKLLTSEGYDFAQPNIHEIKTDNKFIFFNRADGYTVDTWDENTEVVISDIMIPDMENYFILFNRTKNGYTTDTIDKLIDEKSKKYDVLDDIFKNALAFQIKDDGSIGYKYLVRDCDSEEKNYKILSEFSKKGLIHNDEWYTISVKISPIGADKMKLYFYINAKLCFITKEIPLLELKALNDLRDKQVGVPYNISIGGGTQGLCDVIYLDYRKLPEYVLPLEKEFAGSFVGYVKSFKFYNCHLSITEIRENTDFELGFKIH